MSEPPAGEEENTMRFSHEQFVSFCFGAHCLTDSGGAVRIRRFPPALEGHYQSTEAFQIRCGCPAGARLRFRSDTGNLAIAVRYGREARAIYRGVLTVDGDSELPWGPSSRQPEWSGALFSSAERRTREFELWLPHLCETALLALDVDDGASLEPPTVSRRRWLALGDSITQGMTATLPTLTHFGRVTRSLALDSWNLAIGGERLVPPLAAGLPAWAFDIATVAYGTNDCAGGVTLDVWRDNAIRLASALHAASPKAPLLFSTPIPWLGQREPNAIGLGLADYRQALADAVCELRNVHLVDGTQLIDAREELFVDGVHPNDAGFAMYAERLAAAMAPHLPIRVHPTA